MKLLVQDMMKISEFEGNKNVCDDRIELKTLIENAITAILPKAENKK